MEHTYWHRQTADKPLYHDLLWSRPENRAQAGKLVIIGGNLHGFSAPASAYAAAMKAGIGVVRVVLPKAIQKTVGKMVEYGIYVESTPSGSFAKNSLAELLEQAAWADGVLIAGDLGRNSETAILLESFLQKYTGHVTLVKDSVDYVTSSSNAIAARPKTTLVLTMAQLQRLVTNLKFTRAIKFEMPLMQLVDLLHELTGKYPFNVVTKQQGIILVAVKGEVCTTKYQDEKNEFWRDSVGARTAVWWLQNPNKSFEALASATLEKT